jgi:stage II sporulation protein D
MSKILRQNYKYFFLSFLVLFFIAGRPAEFGQEAAFFQGFLIAKPVIRVGLGVNLENIEVRASAGMKIYRAAASYELLESDVSEIQVRGHKDPLNEKFLLQVFQSRRREDAEKTARTLREKIDRAVSVSEGKDENLDGVFQVRVGDFLTRGEALSFIKELIALGYPEAWMIREEITEHASRPRWAMIQGRLVNLDEETALYLIPSNPQSYLTYDGRNYRGIFILRGSPRGTLLINVLNLEDYLKGVVPGELSPYIFGEPEALKAQAVAARTYALKNLGQYGELGFDLLATPQSQVYEGMSIEHPESSRAVEETEGEVAVYDGELINALYTSTCGGATEDVEEIFEGGAVPYLRSTECVLEGDRSVTLTTERRLPAHFENGENVAVKMAVPASLGVFSPDDDPAWFRAPLPAAEAAQWIARAAEASGRKSEPGPAVQATDPLTPRILALMIRDAFGWTERVRTLVGKSEAEYATRELPGLSAEERPILAYFLISGIYSREAEAARETALSRAEAAVVLSRILGMSRDPFKRGVLRSIESGAVAVSLGDENKTVPLAPNPYLVRSVDGTALFVSSLDLEPGESIQWIERDGQVVLLQATSTSLSNVLDQPSQYHTWQVRSRREDLEIRINQYYPVGRLMDLIPQRRGASQRVVELLIVGQEGRAVVKGLNIRQVLNLRDTLFVIDRETDTENRLTHFLFSGKGWGHGVGLCQVGAFRMAQKGAHYGDILKKYYRGIHVEKRT